MKFLGLIAAFLLTGMLMLAFNIQPTETIGTIYIMADGSINPSTAPISTSDNVTYQLTDNINDSIVVKRDNITINGAGWSLQGANVINSIGLDISFRNNITIANLTITQFTFGIYMNNSRNCTIVNNVLTRNNFECIRVYESCGNIITENEIFMNPWDSIVLYGSSNNTISENKIFTSYDGIRLFQSNNNSLIENMLAENSYGIYFAESSSNTILRNSLASNQYGMHFYLSTGNSVIENLFTDDGVVVWYSHDNIIEHNIVNGKPLIYLENASDIKVLDAGQIILVSCKSIFIENLNLSHCDAGLQLWTTENSTITKNNITNNVLGIVLEYSTKNSIHENNIANNSDGIYLCYSSNNSIVGNKLASNDYHGIYIELSNNNSIYHNNFLENTQHVGINKAVNFWDNGYPSGGNYWDGYTYADLFNDHYQNETGSDGVCDAPYAIDVNNSDGYPLMGMFYDFEEAENEGHHVEVVSNSTVSDLKVGVVLDHFPPYLPFLQIFIEFSVKGVVDNTGFCRVTIPRAILNNTYFVLIDYEEITAYELSASNSTHAYLYFTYKHSKQEHDVIIVPEFSHVLILLMLVVFCTLVPILKKTKAKTQLKTNSQFLL